MSSETCTYLSVANRNDIPTYLPGYTPLMNFVMRKQTLKWDEKFTVVKDTINIIHYTY